MSRKSDDFEKPTSNLKFSRNNTDMVSYEDLLIAQYLEELRKAKSEMRRKKDVPASPYTQKLPHSDYGYRIKRRPQSASFVDRPGSGSSNKPKIDAKFIADPNMWDPATPRSDKHSTQPLVPKKFRPASAPVHRKGSSRPISASSNLSWYYGRGPRSAFTSRPWSGRKIRSQYKRQPQIIRVVAFKNGSKENFIRVAAPTMKTLLEFCTDKLNLPFAARRIFLEDGVEVFDARDIPLDGEVYISTGEDYKDPLASEKRNIIIKNGSKWTLSGVLLPENSRKKTKSAKMSKRMKSLIERKRVRIVVYRNGKSTEPVEIVADLNDVQGFLTACTAKLDLRCHARILYDWEGNEINNLAETPILDDCLQPGGTAVLGPLWVSVGEGFSPSATIGYITSIRQVIKIKLQDAERYNEELNFAMNNEPEKVTITAILSMNEEELYETQDMAEREIEQLKKTLQTLNEKVKVIKAEMNNEQAEGSNYRMSHIKEIDVEDRIVGVKGLRLKVYENGFYDQPQTFFFNLSGALRGIGNEKQLILQRLLDELSNSHTTRDAKNPKIAPVAKKIFNEYGTEINDVTKLEYDQEIWVSYGEPYIQPFTYCIQALFDKAAGYSTSEGKTAIIREQLMGEEIKGKDDYHDWDANIGFPPTYPMTDSLIAGGDDHVNMQLAASGLDHRAHYLQCKKKKDLVLYPELVAYKKVPKGDNAVWPTESQVWVISKKGYIYCKSMPSLCLAASDMRTEIYLPGREETTVAFVVTLQKYMTSNPHQQWKFNNDGTISSVGHQDLVLTYSGAKFGDEENYRQPEGILPGHKVYLIVTDRLAKKEAILQRFALKQEKFENLGQWKYTDASNLEWNKLAYSWPVKEDGTLNEDYDWPMEGYIIPNAPPLHKGDRRQSLSGMKPLKLMVVKNGERDVRTAVSVVGPNLTNMMKDLSKEKSDKKKKRSKSQERNMPITNPNKTDVVEVDVNLHCRDLTIRELEFMMFLDHCTSLLNLPFAARRLFDYKGNEHFGLQNLKRDELVFVSCGETWTDPRLTRAEQQRRFLLSQLSQDVAKIRQYCALRNPENYVLEIEGNLTANTGIILNKQWDQDTEDRDFSPTDEQTMSSSKKTSSKADDDEDEDDESDVLGKSAHAISHQKSEQRLNSLKWPWERLVNVDKSLDMDDPEAAKYTDRELYERYRPRTISKTPRHTLQQFTYEDGYIACAGNRDLVLGVLEQESRVNQVMLVKRKPGDINQIWVMKENGEIRSKHNSRLVFTVAMPANEPFAEDEEGRPLTFSRCPLTLQGRRTNVYGKAHQRWHYNADTGYIHAFYTNKYDKEITAANKADVCTYSIAAQTKIDQPGYLAEVPVTTPADRVSVREIMVCTSCARAMRGRYKLQKLPDGTEFICAMGEAKKLKLQQIGSFRVLNGKVDLSTHEAELSLQKWEETLCNLRDETSVRCIAKEINAAKTVKTVKILAYKNGEGRMRQGELVCGSSIEGLLNQCTHRLSLTSAARKIFTEDGTMILEVEDIIDWAVDNYKSLMVDQLERILHGKTQRSLSPTGIVEIYTPCSTLYKNLADFGIDAVKRKSLKFKVKAAFNVHIGLFKNEPNIDFGEVYDIVIGGWGNKQSVIRNARKGKPVTWHSGELLDPDEYQEFWITWKEGVICVGTGNRLDEDIFMKWEDPNPRAVNHVAIATSAKNDGNWMFEKNEYECTPKRYVAVESSKTAFLVSIDDNPIDDESSNSRGIHVMELNEVTGDVMSKRVFDTFSANQDTELVKHLNTIEKGRILILAVKDEGARSLRSPARQYLKDKGSAKIEHLGFRDMWTFIYIQGGKKIAEAHVKSPNTSTWAEKATVRTELPLSQVREAEVEEPQVIQTRKHYDWQDLAHWGINPIKAKSLVFRVKAKNDAYIGLFPDTPSNTTNYYEIVIGGWGNKTSVIRNTRQGQPKAQNSAVNFLDPNSFREFWMSWHDGIIHVGYGNVVGNNVFMEWQDPEPYEVNHVAITSISTGQGAAGDWIFETKAQIKEREEPEPQVIHTSKQYDYQNLAQHGINPIKAKSMAFKVKANNDAHIGLFFDVPNNKVTDFFELVIGGWGNKGSVIRCTKQGQNKASDFSGNFLDRESYREFWISWYDGIIRVGYGNVIGDDVFMEWKDPKSYHITHVAITTGWGSEGDWIFETSEDERRQERGEGEGRDSPSDVDNDAAEVDEKEGEKVAKERDELLQQISIPSVDTILRYPIEVWVSSGRDFVAPEVVESKVENRKKKRAFRSSVSMELDIEKHCLRQMKGRRLDGLNPGEYKATRSYKQPVVIEGNWQDPTVEEQMKHDTVHKLETHLAEVKANQREKTVPYTSSNTMRLYKQPDTKRIMVYPNGESIEWAMYIWGDTLDQLLDNATIKLNMWQRAKFMYNMEGKLIENFSEVERDQLLCVSAGKPFQKPQGTKEGIEIKANWSRARKQYGPQATEFVVDPSQNPKVDVDPFGPPELTMPQESQERKERPKTAKVKPTA